MAYTEMVMIIRKLYQDCRLVHGDLSEYNILFHEVSIDGSTFMVAPQARAHMGACNTLSLKLPHMSCTGHKNLFHLAFLPASPCMRWLSSQIKSLFPLLHLYCWVWAMFNAEFV